MQSLAMAMPAFRKSTALILFVEKHIHRHCGLTCSAIQVLGKAYLKDACKGHMSVMDMCSPLFDTKVPELAGCALAQASCVSSMRQKPRRRDL